MWVGRCGVIGHTLTGNCSDVKHCSAGYRRLHVLHQCRSVSEHWWHLFYFFFKCTYKITKCSLDKRVDFEFVFAFCEYELWCINWAGCWWLALMPHSKKVLSSNRLAENFLCRVCMFSMRLHCPSLGTQHSSHHPEMYIVRITGISKLAAGLNVSTNGCHWLNFSAV